VFSSSPLSNAVEPLYAITRCAQQPASAQQARRHSASARKYAHAQRGCAVLPEAESQRQRMRRHAMIPGERVPMICNNARIPWATRCAQQRGAFPRARVSGIVRYARRIIQHVRYIYSMRDEAMLPRMSASSWHLGSTSGGVTRASPRRRGRRGCRRRSLCFPRARSRPPCRVPRPYETARR